MSKSKLFNSKEVKEGAEAAVALLTLIRQGQQKEAGVLLYHLTPDERAGAVSLLVSGMLTMIYRECGGNADRIDHVIESMRVSAAEVNR